MPNPQGWRFRLGRGADAPIVPSKAVNRLDARLELAELRKTHPEARLEEIDPLADPVAARKAAKDLEARRQGLREKGA